MKIKTKFKDLFLIQQNRFLDNRGYFKELIQEKKFNLKFPFVVMSFSKKNVIRGLHIQTNDSQGKFVSVIKGKIFDVAIDLRKVSKTYGKVHKCILSEKNKRSIFIPQGFAHGFQALSDDTIMLYQCTGPYSPESERCINVFDKRLNIVWEDTKDAIISQKDLMGIDFKNADYF